MSFPNLLSFLPFDKLGEVIFIERICLAEIAVEIWLVVPDLSRRCSLFEEEDDRFDACSGECAAGKIEDGVQIAAFEQRFAKGDRGVVAV